MHTRGQITKTSYDFLQDYLKLDHKSVVSSRLAGTVVPYRMINLMIIVNKLQLATLEHLNFIVSLPYDIL